MFWKIVFHKVINYIHMTTNIISHSNEKGKEKLFILIERKKEREGNGKGEQFSYFAAIFVVCSFDVLHFSISNQSFSLCQSIQFPIFSYLSTSSLFVETTLYMRFCRIAFSYSLQLI